MISHPRRGQPSYRVYDEDDFPAGMDAEALLTRADRGEPRPAAGKHGGLRARAVLAAALLAAAGAVLGLVAVSELRGLAASRSGVAGGSVHGSRLTLAGPVVAHPQQGAATESSGRARGRRSRGSRSGAGGGVRAITAGLPGARDGVKVAASEAPVERASAPAEFGFER